MRSHIATASPEYIAKTQGGHPISVLGTILAYQHATRKNEGDVYATAELEIGDGSAGGAGLR
jgi:hypothetical protein